MACRCEREWGARDEPEVFSLSSWQAGAAVRWDGTPGRTEGGDQDVKFNMPCRPVSGRAEQAYFWAEVWSSREGQAGGVTVEMVLKTMKWVRLPGEAQIKMRLES